MLVDLQQQVALQGNAVVEANPFAAQQGNRAVLFGSLVGARLGNRIRISARSALGSGTAGSDCLTVQRRRFADRPESHAGLSSCLKSSGMARCVSSSSTARICSSSCSRWWRWCKNSTDCSRPTAINSPMTIAPIWTRKPSRSGCDHEVHALRAPWQGPLGEEAWAQVSQRGRVQAPLVWPGVWRTARPIFAHKHAPVFVAPLAAVRTGS